MIPHRIVHLLSGGLDSVVLMHDLLDQKHFVHALIVDYKQQHRKEIDFAIRQSNKCNVLYTVISMPSLGGLNCDSWIVPNRNAILISLAVNIASKANADEVTIGCNADDASMFPDCRPAFIESMNSATNAAGFNVRICAPYISKRKWEIGAIAREMGIRSSDIWTCYRGGEVPCGSCPACEKLKTAFA